VSVRVQKGVEEMVGLLSFIVCNVRHEVKLAWSVFATCKYRLTGAYMTNLIRAISYLFWTRDLGPTMRLGGDIMKIVVEKEKVDLAKRNRVGEE
jgi:hypothetical protein